MKHFKFIEMVNSTTATQNKIDNWPNDPDIMDNIIFTMECLDQIREEYGKPLYITSGYRCPELNRTVGGVKTSQHLKGQAADINLGSVEKNRAFFDWCRNNADFDQLIDEKKGQWVHISFNKNGNRKQVLYL